VEPPTAGRERTTVRTAFRPPEDEARLLSRAQLLIGRGDIGAARGILERAMAEGSAEAAFSLGETYDEKKLTQWNVLGTQPDAGKARELYRRAYDAGYSQSKQQIDTTDGQQK
jgi:TPR repeat protein